MEMYSHELKIPKERVAVLIGKNGEIKKELEEATKVHIDVDSLEGDVIISGNDAINLFSMREIVKAIGRGFNPEIARLLMKTDYCFELVNILDFAKTKKDLLRLRGRVIGSEGKSRKFIEDTCRVNIVVYGKTIGIIGESQYVSVAKRAIELLLNGSPHSSVNKWLEKQRRELKKIEILGDTLIKDDLKESGDETDANDTGKGQRGRSGEY